MNIKFHEICAMSEEISVDNGNIHVLQDPFSNGAASNKKKKKKSKLEQRNTCMKLNCSINLHLGFYKMSVRTDRQCRSRSDCLDCTV